MLQSECNQLAISGEDFEANDTLQLADGVAEDGDLAGSVMSSAVSHGPPAVLTVADHRASVGRASVAGEVGGRH
jgi:hypothetical protein